MWVYWRVLVFYYIVTNYLLTHCRKWYIPWDPIIFRCIFLSEKSSILIEIFLRFVPRSPIYNKPTLIQIIIWTNDGIYASLIKLTHWGWDKTAAISQMTFSSAFLLMITFELQTQTQNILYFFYDSIGSDNGLALIRRQAVIGTNDGKFYRLIYASLGLNGLILSSAVIAQTNIIFCICYDNDWGKIRGYIHKRHPISNLYGWAMGCLWVSILVKIHLAITASIKYYGIHLSKVHRKCWSDQSLKCVLR